MSPKVPKPDIASKIMDMSGVPLADFLQYTSPLFEASKSHVVAGVEHIPITASGSQGAKRVGD